MRLKAKGIEYRNEVNILNPKELWQWLCGTHYLRGYIFKVDGINVTGYGDIDKLSKNQIKRAVSFIEKNCENLPIGLIERFEDFMDKGKKK